MSTIIIHGGKELNGKINISGAKNSALPIMAASLLTSEQVVLSNIPKLGDVRIMSDLIRSIGAKVGINENTITLKADSLHVEDLWHNALMTKIRYSTHLIGALLPHFKEVTIPTPGGCSIGTRRLDSHLLGFKSMGAKIDLHNEYIRISANELHGCNARLEFPSVGATENLIAAASVAKGNSIIENVAKEPEIIDLANFLNSMGAKISGAGTETIRIEGVDELSGTEYSIIPDRIETGTYVIAAAVTNGNLILKNASDQCENVLAKLKEAGVKIDKVKSDLHVTSSGNRHPINVITEVYPGFPTDMQPLITTLLSITTGDSVIKETIYDGRFNHVPELQKMGAKIKVMDDTLHISGVEKLKGEKICARDIRAGGSLMLAGLCAQGKTEITGVDQILRGYEDPTEKLRGVGADIVLKN